MTQKDIPNFFLPVSELIEKLEDGLLSSLELIEEYLERIRKHDRNLGAFIDVYGEEARKAASASDMARASGHIIGPLQGIPV
ncbi:MAG: amidase family protein, partial [SAR324 cluster bacterium]|nr:amidase family protein [SAR324 cluster bacterium]